MENSETDDLRDLAVRGIRMRPAMYVGSLDRPAIGTHLLQEACCLAFDHAATGCCDRIVITVEPDGSASVSDNGPGLPVTEEERGQRWVEQLFTEVYACRDRKTVKKIAQRVCGMGLAVTNALSTYCHVRTTCDDAWWEQHYRFGIPESPFQSSGPAVETGTTIAFQPDTTLLPDPAYDLRAFEQWLETVPLPRNQIHLTIHDNR